MAPSQKYPHLNGKNRIFACHLRWRCVNEHPNADSFFIGLFTNNCKKSDFIHLSVLSISIRIFFIRMEMALQRYVIHTNGIYASKTHGRTATNYVQTYSYQLLLLPIIQVPKNQNVRNMSFKIFTCGNLPH